MGAVNKYDLDCYKYAVFFVSDDIKRIAVLFTNDEKESGVIQIQKRSGSFAISASSFFKLYEIDYDITKRLRFNWIKEERTAFFRLSDTQE